MKRSFFQAAVTSILLYGCTTWTLTKRLEKKLDGNYTRMLRAILNKSWQQHPTRYQLYGHLPPITKTIQVRRTRHAGHCWRSRDDLIRDVLLWIPTHGRAKAGRPARTYIQQLCEDTGCCPEDLPRAMNDREEWRERVRDIRAASTIWWWWWRRVIILLFWEFFTPVLVGHFSLEFEWQQVSSSLYDSSQYSGHTSYFCSFDSLHLSSYIQVFQFLYQSFGDCTERTHQLLLVSPSPSYSIDFFSSLARPRYLSLFSLSFNFTLACRDIKINNLVGSLFFVDYHWILLPITRFLLFIPLEFFTSVLADGFSLEFEWQQVSSSLQDSSQYSGRLQQCCRLDSLYPSTNLPL